MNARTAAFCLLGSIAVSGAASARLTPIDTEHDAAGALHTGIVVAKNAYNFAVLTSAAEALALDLLDPLSPTAPKASTASPVVIPCPGGGSYSAQWRDLADAGGCSFVLRVDYNQCRAETEDPVIEENGPVSITVLLPPRAKPRVLSVRYGSDAAASFPARDFARTFSRRTPEGGLIVETELVANYAVAGRFMQHIGEVGQLEGDFAYEIGGRLKETGHFLFDGNVPGTIVTGFDADGLLVRGSQRRQPGADGAFASEDDTFDIDVRYLSGTLTRLNRGPSGDQDLPFSFENLTITTSELIFAGSKTITLDGVVSVAYPTIADQQCVSGTFRFATRQPLLDQPTSGTASPWIVRGGLQINHNVVASFSSESNESPIDVSLNRGAPVRFGGWSSLETALPCFAVF
jgi:hypothetical protein